MFTRTIFHSNPSLTIIDTFSGNEHKKRIAVNRNLLGEVEPRADGVRLKNANSTLRMVTPGYVLGKRLIQPAGDIHNITWNLKVITNKKEDAITTLFTP